MPTYRIHYVECLLVPHRPITMLGVLPRFGPDSALRETVWKELVRAKSAPEALAIFFGNHAIEGSELAWIDPEGEAHGVEEQDFDPRRTYIWIEDGRRMELRGIDEVGVAAHGS